MDNETLGLFCFVIVIILLCQNNKKINEEIASPQVADDEIKSPQGAKEDNKKPEALQVYTTEEDVIIYHHNLPQCYKQDKIHEETNVCTLESETWWEKTYYIYEVLDKDTSISNTTVS